MMKAQQVLPELSQISKIQTIEMRSDWMGLSEVGPIGRHYILKPEAGQFTGHVTFSIGGGPNTKTKDEAIFVPLTVMQGVLNRLAQAPMEKGVYQPHVDHTDDYPSFRIDVQCASGKISFFSTSQGEWAMPWGVSLGGASVGSESYIINAKNPAEAMDDLKPYFKEDDFGKFLEDVRKQLKKSRK